MSEEAFKWTISKIYFWQKEKNLRLKELRNRKRFLSLQVQILLLSITNFLSHRRNLFFAQLGFRIYVTNDDKNHIELFPLPHFAPTKLVHENQTVLVWLSIESLLNLEPFNKVLICASFLLVSQVWEYKPAVIFIFTVSVELRRIILSLSVWKSALDQKRIHVTDITTNLFQCI